jgi:hypothetical protein
MNFQDKLKEAETILHEAMVKLDTETARDIVDAAQDIITALKTGTTSVVSGDADFDDLYNRDEDFRDYVKTKIQEEKIKDEEVDAGLARLKREWDIENRILSNLGKK